MHLSLVRLTIGNGRHMARLTTKLMNRAFGFTQPGPEGMRRTLRGMREGDRRELLFGLALAGLAYLQRTKPRRQLIHSQTIPEGSTVVIRNTEPGKPHLEITEPEG